MIKLTIKKEDLQEKLKEAIRSHLMFEYDLPFSTEFDLDETTIDYIVLMDKKESEPKKSIFEEEDRFFGVPSIISKPKDPYKNRDVIRNGCGSEL